MATFYVGYKNVLRGRNDPVNTYTGLLGTYSNWELMNTSHVLDGAPDINVQPGTGDYPHGLQLSRWFLGLDPAGREMANAGIAYPDVYAGRWVTWVFRGLATPWSVSPAGAQDLGTGGYGHLFLWGGTSADYPNGGTLAPYASLGYFYYGIITEKSGALKDDSTLGHLSRYPFPNVAVVGEYGDPYAAASSATNLQPSSFGAFHPYQYKGIVTEKSDPLASDVVALGHVVYPARTDPVNQADHYGFEHSREWFGVPSAQAL